MLIPRIVAGKMALVDNAPLEFQTKMQKGCSCCGWVGDPFLLLRIMPKEIGQGFAILHKEPGTPAVILYRSDTMQADPGKIDHRIITWLAEARKNWEQKDKIAEMMDAHDAQVEQDVRREQAEMTVELSKQVRHMLKKEGKI